MDAAWLSVLGAWHDGSLRMERCHSRCGAIGSLGAANASSRCLFLARLGNLPAENWSCCCSGGARQAYCLDMALLVEYDTLVPESIAVKVLASPSPSYHACWFLRRSRLLGSPVVPFCPFNLGVSLFKPNIRKKGILIMKGLLGNLGFMVAENSGYFPRALDSFLATLWRFNNREDVILQVVLDFLEFLCFRIILNPHPYLTGIVAGRFAKGQIEAAKQQHSIAVLWKVLWPSAVLHALLNIFSGLPLLRLILVFICGQVFRDTWESLPEPEDENSTAQH